MYLRMMVALIPIALSVSASSIFSFPKHSFFESSYSRYLFIGYCISWYGLYADLSRINMRRVLPVVFREWKTLVIILGFLALYAGLIGLMTFVVKWLREHVENLRFYFGGVVAVVILVLGIRWLRFWIRDSLRFRGVDHSRLANREYIAEIIMGFHLNWFEVKLIRLIEKHVVFAKGNWPDGILPKTRSGEASTYLLRLEEKWLGLER